MLKILADENMPYVEQLFAPLGQVTTLDGRAMTADDLIDIDVLLVRSITQVNEALLRRANALKFVGTATIGTDHIDHKYLEQRGIPWSSAPGCNATAVAEYVISAMLIYSERTQVDLTDKTVAIVGAGNIGTRLAKKLSALNIDYFFCDPPKQRAGSIGDYRPWSEVANADIVTLHVPIVKTGQDATYHMVDDAFLSSLKPDAMLINSCRGDVVDNNALRQHLMETSCLFSVMDVWQNEPEIDTKLLSLVDIATPHIAGYSLEGKANGTYFLYQRWCELTDQSVAITLESLLPRNQIQSIALSNMPTMETISKISKLVYDIRDDDQLCRSAGFSAKGFDNLRKQYKVRREFSALSIQCDNAADGAQLSQLGFNVIDNNQQISVGEK